MDELNQIKLENTNKLGALNAGKRTDESSERCESEEKINCYYSSCKKTFHNISALQKHIQIHKKEKPFECVFCNKCFLNVYHLKMHQNSHKQATSFQCEMCPRIFKSKSSLNWHMKKHVGKREYFCKVCSASFYSEYDLKIHAAGHEGDLPYKCKECSDQFAVASRLKRHMMLHTRERPFQCEICGVIFREKFTLSSHMAVHLPNQSHTCDMCGETFSRLNSLTLHKRAHRTNGTYSYVPKKYDQKSKTSVHVKCEPPSHVIDNVQKSSPDEPVDHNKCSGQSLRNICFPDNINVMNVSSVKEILSHVTNSSVEAKNNHGKKSSEEGVHIPHPRVVQEPQSIGTLLESQSEDGKGYLIFLPKTFLERNYTLFTVPSLPNSTKGRDSENKILKGNYEIVNPSGIILDEEDDNNSIESIVGIDFQNFEEVEAEDITSMLNKPRVQEILSQKENDAIHTELQLTRLEKSPVKKRQKKKKSLLLNKRYDCQQCGKGYKTLSSLNVHIRSHTGERPYYCDYCGMGFKQLPHLKSHVRIHTGETPYQCQKCDQAFHQSSRLRYHMQSFHTDGRVVKGKSRNSKDIRTATVRNFYCKICKATFLNSCFKADHMKTHSYETLYHCEKCDATFRWKASLRKHLKSHANDKWSICEVCGLQCKYLSQLKIHKEEIHNISECNEETSHPRSDEKCLTYNDKYSNNYDLNKNDNDLQLNSATNTPREIPIHKNNSLYVKTLQDGKFQCTVCDKKFNTRSNVYVHIRLHSDLRPYKCNACGKAFKQISHLKDHAKRHTGEKPFKCSICLAVFAQSSGAKVHIKKYHRGNGVVINERRDVINFQEESITFEYLPESYDDNVVITVDSC